MGREINIVVVGASGTGKSKVGDLLRNTIFKLDGNSKIVTSDPDRENKTFGEGENTYNIAIKKILPEELVNRSIPPDELSNHVIIILTSSTVDQWFQEVLES